MKMIAAILAVLAVALGGVYALDDAQAAGDNYTPAQWPGPSPEPAASYSDFDFYPSTLFGAADWIKDTDYVYWLDQTQTQGNWVTILGGTEVEINGTYESFRIKSQGPASADLKDFIVTDLEIKFYDDVHTDYAVVNTNIDNYPANKPLNLDEDKAIQTPVGTIYVDAMQVQLKGNLYQKDANGKITTTVITNYTKVVSIPVLVKKANIGAEYECFYTFNGLMQSPIAELNTVGNKSANVYTYDGENPVPYIDLTNPGNYFWYPELPAGVEVEWEVSDDSTTVAGYTNKHVAWTALIGTDDQIVGMTEDGKLLNKYGQVVTLDVKPYTITLTPVGSNLVTGDITITWWILPLGLDDIEFIIDDPYYNYDEEVRPIVDMRWYEPEDGPNGPAKHSVNKGNYTFFEYTMPEFYPYEMPTLLDDDGNVVYVSYVQKIENGKPAYLMDGDEYVLDKNGYRIPLYEQETVLIDGQVYAVYEKQALDEYGRPVYKKMLFKEDGTTPVTETVQALDKYGNPVYYYVYDYTGWKLMVGESPVYSHTAVTYDLVQGNDGVAVTSTEDTAPAVPQGAPEGAVWDGAAGNWALIIPASAAQPVYIHYNTTAEGGVAVTSTETNPAVPQGVPEGAQWNGAAGEWTLMIGDNTVYAHYDTTAEGGVAVTSTETNPAVPQGAPEGAVWDGAAGNWALVIPASDAQPVYSHTAVTYDTTQGTDGVAVVSDEAKKPTETYGVENAVWIETDDGAAKPVDIDVTDKSVIPTVV